MGYLFYMSPGFPEETLSVQCDLPVAKAFPPGYFCIDNYFITVKNAYDTVILDQKAAGT